MPIWKLEPAATADDPRWQDHPVWNQVIVRAPSAAMARVLASALDSAPGAPSLGNESLDTASAFADEKLYWVEQLTDQRAAHFNGEDGPVGIVETVK